MSDDIKARLRVRASAVGIGLKQSRDMHKAADRIEALEAEVARLRGALGRIDHNAGYTYDSCRAIARAALAQDKDVT